MYVLSESYEPETGKQIWALPYSSFIGWINQWNVPPGALSTISTWSVFGNVNQESDLATLEFRRHFIADNEISDFNIANGLIHRGPIIPVGATRLVLTISFFKPSEFVYGKIN